MIKISLKIQFVLLLISLFFIGLGIETIIEEKAYSGTALLKQLSHIGPFAISSIILIRNIYYKGIKKSREDINLYYKHSTLNSGVFLFKQQ